MAGQPLKRQMVAALEARAAEASTADEPITVLDYIHDFIASGKTVKDLNILIGKDINRALANSGTLTSYINSTPEGRAMLAQARKLAADAFAEETIDIIDMADESKEALTKAKLRMEGRQWLASKYNRQVYGNEAAQVNVMISSGQQHLDALRMREVEVSATPLLPPAAEGADYEIMVPELVEDSDHVVVVGRPTGTYGVEPAPQPSAFGQLAEAVDARLADEEAPYQGD